MKTISRREFIGLSLGTSGLAAIVLGTKTLMPSMFQDTESKTFLPLVFQETEYLAGYQAIELSVEEVLKEMVDRTPVFMWAFKDPVLGPRVPGPVIIVQEGCTVAITVTNNLRESHGFTVPGLLDGGIIRPGESRLFEFPAQRGGTYLYFDPVNAPVNRVLGLHGVMVVTPEVGNSPYSDPTPQVQQLFNDLGASGQFPGYPWDPRRSFIWVFSQIDPALNSLVQNNQMPDPASFVRNFLPRYFTINGKSGFFSSHDPDIAPHGRVGEPALIRVVNAGLATHSPHIHGNHVYVLSNNGVVQDNVFLLDTWNMRPLDRKDVLLPFVKPPDIPPAAWPPSEERFPLRYPMHCHMEMSQTAAGGNYPQGLITDWVIDGPLA